MMLKNIDECIRYCEIMIDIVEDDEVKESNKSLLLHLLIYKGIDEFLNTPHLKSNYDYIIKKSLSRNKMLEMKIKNIKKDLLIMD